MTEYKRLGDYIEPVDERNSKLEIKLSQGICNEKYFQDPRQVAENSAADKIVRRGYFAYNRATTRNGEKISIAYREGPDCTVSSAYQVFRIKDEEKLNPKYLLMWYKRSDFDRYARFRSHGSAHEFFEYDEMCDVYLPLPDIDRQRAIVEEYETLSRRIRLNEQMIEKLEATAQALYRKMFVDGIDKENLPEGWRMRTLDDICIINPKLSLKINTAAPFFDMDSLPTRGFFIDKVRYREFGSGMKFQNDDVLLARITPCMENGKAAIISDLGNEETAFGSTEFIVLRGRHQKLTSILATLVRNEYFREYAKKQMKGTDGRQRVEASALSLYEMVIPGNSILADIENDLSKLYIDMHLKTKENSKLSELQSLLLAKMGNLKQ